MRNIAVITGASGGIGRCFAKTLSNHGNYDEVWLIARDREKLEGLQKKLGILAKVIPLDLTKKGSLEKYKELLEKEKPNVKLLINCAGYGKFDSFEKLSYEENIGIIDLDCRALTAMTYLTLAYMKKESEIVNVSSVAAFQPVPYVSVYGAAKAYVLSFSRALAREVGKHGVRVFTVCPFWTRTEFFDRAIDKTKKAVVKKYIAMYEPSYIVACTWQAMKRKRDFCIPGYKAKVQAALSKLLPHSAVMDIWMAQQKLKN